MQYFFKNLLHFYNFVKICARRLLSLINCLIEEISHNSIHLTILDTSSNIGFSWRSWLQIKVMDAAHSPGYTSHSFIKLIGLDTAQSPGYSGQSWNFLEILDTAHSPGYSIPPLYFQNVIWPGEGGLNCWPKKCLCFISAIFNREIYTKVISSLTNGFPS